MDDVLILISTTKTQNAYGVWEETESEHQVFCEISSITRQEFYQAGRNGINPEFVATVFDGDYSGERVCAWRGNRYAIYRVYRASGKDYVELYAQREGGTNYTEPPVQQGGGADGQADNP